MTTLNAEQRKQQIWSVIRVSSGNFLEMYDFFLFAYYATHHRHMLLPRRQRVRLADAGAVDLRRRISHAPAGSDRARRLSRPITAAAPGCC